MSSLMNLPMRCSTTPTADSTNSTVWCAMSSAEVYWLRVEDNSQESCKKNDTQMWLGVRFGWVSELAG